MLDLPPDTEARLREQAARRGLDVNNYLHLILNIEEASLSPSADEIFQASAEATRHIWDTPEEDAAWAHL